MSSGVEATARIVHRATPNPPTSAGSHTETDTKGASNDAREDTKKLKKALLRKYRHTVAVHSQVRPSTLSHDATQTPSFIGFRNLGLIVLSKLSSCCTVMPDRNADIVHSRRQPPIVD